MRIEFDTGERIRVTDCWVHPEAIGGVMLSGCGELVGRTEDNISVHHDLAILELERAVVLTPRSVAPPRWCLGPEVGSALAQSRGAGRGVAGRMRREAISSSYRGSAFSQGWVLCFHDDVVESGDSGGTIDAWNDPSGPMVGVNSEGGQGTACNQQPLLWQHDPGPGRFLERRLRNIDWIWSVLDPGETCSFGSSGPCVPARLGRTLVDTDLDGLPDIRDLCPSDPLSAADAAACANQHCDVDGDWVGDECDDFDGIDNVTGLPNAEVVACNHDDEDGDGIPGAADPCPLIPASATDTDEDGDGVPDVCDVCPGLDNALVDFSLDSESEPDGVPDECDNCVMDPNPLQHDCNLDAELALWAVRCPPDMRGEPTCPRLDFTIGDACDETPCGETRVQRETHGTRADRELVQNAVRVDARAAVDRDARTGFRFCRCRSVTRNDLEQREVCYVEDIIPAPIPEDPTVPPGPDIRLGNCGPLDGDDYDLVAEPHNWRWTTMAFALDPLLPADADTRTGPMLRTERDLRYDAAADGGSLFVTDLWASWLLRDHDVPRWRAAPFEEPISGGLLARLGGVLWTHTPGPIGGGDATAWERDLASHFWSGRGWMSTLPPFPSRRPVPCIQPIGPLIIPGVFGTIPRPWLGFATFGCPIALPDLRVVLRVGPDVFERQAGFDPAWFDEFQVRDVRWVVAAESDGWLPEEDIRYVGLSSTDLALRALLEERDGGLIDVIKEQPCGPKQCDPPPVLPGPLGLTASSVTIPNLLVLSARRRTLWAIDGSSIGGGGARIRALDIERREWRELTGQGMALGRPLAATYSPIEDALFIIDEVMRGRSAHARLLRVDVGLRTARARVVANWPRRARNDRFAMAVDPSGALYIAGTRTDGRRSAIVRLEPNRSGRYRPTAFRLHAGRFVPEGLRADEHGVTLVLDDPIEGAFPVSIGRHELRGGPGGMRHCL